MNPPVKKYQLTPRSHLHDQTGSRLRPLLAGLLGGALLAVCFAPQAAAQTPPQQQQQSFAFTPGRIPVLYKKEGDNLIALRPDPQVDLKRFGKNLCDCKRPYVLNIPALMPNPQASTGNVEIWVGNTCDDISTTNGNRIDRCKQLRTKLLADFANEQNFEFTANEFLQLRDSADQKIKECLPAPGEITFWILVDIGNDGMFEFKDSSLKLGYDGVAPAGATDVKVSSGDGKISLSWSISNNDANQISNGGGYQVYCVKDVDTPVLPVGRAAQFIPSCMDPPKGLLDPKYLCTDAITGGPSAVISGLENNGNYRFAVIAYDRELNPAPVTEMNFVAGVPIPTTDGYELYRMQGGKATGGFCAAHPGAWGGRTLAPFLLGACLLLGIGMIRRRSQGENARDLS